MNSNLAFEFIVDKATSTVTVNRAFAAKSSLVWDAFTKPEILDQWWAPKPWMARTKSMDFKVGGRRLYAMVGPEGEEHWALADFTSITPQTNFQYIDAFCDKDGNLNTEFPRMEWSFNFIDKGETTMVNMVSKHKNLADLEKILELGFKEGFTIALDGLDELFAKS
ncbi:MAG: SRPBCC domain-containing protein [Bacteroidota bacterium]